MEHALKAKKENMIFTLIIWTILGAICMGAMLWTAAHKTIVITDTTQSQGESFLDSKSNQQQLQGLELLLQADETMDNRFEIPLQKGIKAEQVVMENHYIDKELWIYIQDAEAVFFETSAISGNVSLLAEGLCEIQENGVILKLQVNNVFEYRSTLEDGKLLIEYFSPKDLYQQIVVIDPVCGGEESGIVVGECIEKDIVLQIAKKVSSKVESSDIKVYYTRLEDSDVSKLKRLELIEAVKADYYLGICASESPENPSLYGIQGFYNKEYYIPDFGNVQLADIVTRNVTVASKNRAVGLTEVKEDNILLNVRIPAAGISVGYMTNEQERSLLMQESYQEKLAEGIANAIMEVYTSRYEK